ncbi:MAG: hypothetical protein RR595_10825 [Lysinibacillus sp.]
MITIHYYENKSSVLIQLLTRIPAIDEAIKIKGRKGKIDRVVQVDENNYHAYITFEKETKKQTVTKELGKKRR